MTIEKELNIDLIRVEAESHGFTITNADGDLNFTSRNSITFVISKSRLKEGVYNLDFSLSNQYGLPDFVREWNDGSKLLEYVASVCFPTLQYLGGFTTIEEEKVKETVKSILEKNSINYTCHENLLMEIKKTAPSGKMVSGKVNQPCYCFEKNNQKYAIFLYGSFLKFALISGELENLKITSCFPWYCFCPVYKTGTDYAETAVKNFLEFVEITNRRTL